LKIEKEIRTQIFHVDNVLIHYEPQKKETSKLAVPLKEDKQSVSEHFGEVPYFYLATIRKRDGTFISEAYHRNLFATEEREMALK